jgi:hypothetical protein
VSFSCASLQTTGALAVFMNLPVGIAIVSIDANPGLSSLLF